MEFLTRYAYIMVTYVKIVVTQQIFAKHSLSINCPISLGVFWTISPGLDIVPESSSLRET